MKQLKTILTFDDAYQSALKKLSLSDCSCKAMHTYLSRRGCCEEIAQAVLKKLLEHNYINDTKLCTNLCERWQDEGLYSKKMLKAKLIKQGFDKNIINEVIEEFDVDEKSKAKKLFLSYIKRIRKYDDKTVGKIIRYLASKGFSYSIIKDVLEGNRDVLVSSEQRDCLDTYFKNLYN